MAKEICPRCDFPRDHEEEKCFICGYEYIEDKTMSMLNLPKIEYKRLGWNIPQQLRKIGEEFGEVAEAVAQENPVQVIRESLDAIQTLDTLINMVTDEYGIKLEKFYREHEEKLKSKGYL